MRKHADVFQLIILQYRDTRSTNKALISTRLPCFVHAHGQGIHSKPLQQNGCYTRLWDGQQRAMECFFNLLS